MFGYADPFVRRQVNNLVNGFTSAIDLTSEENATQRGTCVAD